MDTSNAGGESAVQDHGVAARANGMAAAANSNCDYDPLKDEAAGYLSLVVDSHEVLGRAIGGLGMPDGPVHPDEKAYLDRLWRVQEAVLKSAVAAFERLLSGAEIPGHEDDPAALAWHRQQLVEEIRRYAGCSVSA
jgi:hypothetical protein